MPAKKSQMGKFQVKKGDKSEENDRERIGLYLRYWGPEDLLKRIKIKPLEQSDPSKRIYPDETHNSLFPDSFYRGILMTHQNDSKP
jgi:hypothetical protein